MVTEHPKLNLAAPLQQFSLPRKTDGEVFIGRIIAVTLVRRLALIDDFTFSGIHIFTFNFEDYSSGLP